MISSHLLCQVEVHDTFGRTSPQVTNALAQSQLTSEFRTRSSHAAQGNVRCTTCNNRLTQLPCLSCKLRHIKVVARFPAAEVPSFLSATERQKLELSLADLLPMRSANYLGNVGIYTVCDVLNRTQRELLAIPGIGKDSLRHIFRALDDLNFDTTKARKAFCQMHL